MTIDYEIMKLLRNVSQDKDLLIQSALNVCGGLCLGTFKVLDHFGSFNVEYGICRYGRDEIRIYTQKEGVSLELEPIHTYWECYMPEELEDYPTKEKLAKHCLFEDL